MESLKILQVVGYKNSGKTTLIKNWIKECAKENREVAIIKHHGHQHGLDMPSNKTDSMTFFETGAKSAIVSDGTTIQLHQRNEESSLKQLVTLARFSEPSIILIEGFKEADYPKVVIVKSETDWDTLKTLSNIVLVLGHVHTNISNHPTLSINQTREINDWFKKWMRGDFHKTV